MEQEEKKKRREEKYQAKILAAVNSGAGMLIEASAGEILSTVAEAEMGIPPEVDGPMALACRQVAVLFDFDGTLGDTETPAMEVAFWELAPYFVGVTPTMLTEGLMKEFIRDNAGKAFEFMVDTVDQARKDAGQRTVQQVAPASP
jgi:hypothetical protein